MRYAYLCTAIYEKRLEDSVAQLVEQYTFNVWVLGSSPSGITKEAKASFFLCLIISILHTNVAFLTY